MNWVNSIGMNEYAINLVNSGVHGGLIALDNTFDYERLAMALQIPTSDNTVRMLLYCLYYAGLLLVVSKTFKIRVC